jgi:hypothetical protein
MLSLEILRIKKKTVQNNNQQEDTTYKSVSPLEDDGIIIKIPLNQYVNLLFKYF